MFQGNFKGAFREVHGCYRGVLQIFHGCFMGVLKYLKDVFRCFMGVSRVLMHISMFFKNQRFAIRNFHILVLS